MLLSQTWWRPGRTQPDSGPCPAATGGRGLGGSRPAWRGPDWDRGRRWRRIRGTPPRSSTSTSTSERLALLSYYEARGSAYRLERMDLPEVVALPPALLVSCSITFCGSKVDELSKAVSLRARLIEQVDRKVKKLTQSSATSGLLGTRVPGYQGRNSSLYHRVHGVPRKVTAGRKSTTSTIVGLLLARTSRNSY